MKYNKELARSIIILIVFGVIITGGILFYSKNKATQHVKQNKLAELTATQIANEFPAPEVEFTDPAHNLSVVSYWDSMETGSYAIYDANNDILYKGIGGSTYTTSDMPLAFVGTDKLLLSVDDEEMVYNKDGDIITKSTLIVEDFNNKIIKKLPDDMRLKSPIYTRYGDVITLDTNKGSFNLDSKTLELTPVKIKYDISTWKEYKNDILGISFSYPSDFSAGDFSPNIGENAISVSFDKENDPHALFSFHFVAASKDYVTPQEPAYLVTGGWDESSYSKSYIVNAPISNVNTTIHIIKSKDPKGDVSCEVCPGLGYHIGGIINTKNKEYPGIIFEMPDTELSRQILKTVKIYNLASNSTETLKEYKNDLLGFSFSYPARLGDVSVNVADGETGQEFIGKMTVYEPKVKSFGFFGGQSKDFTAGRDGGEFEFSGYRNYNDLKEMYAFAYSLSSTKKIQEISTKSGDQGILLEDLHTPMEIDGLGDYVPEGESDFFFNLKKFNGGLQFKFDRKEIPEYKDIIDSLKIY